MRRKIVLALLMVIIITTIGTVPAFADVPYQSYNYDYWKNVVPSLAPYQPVRTISGSDLGTSAFNLPNSLAVDKQGNLYVVDTGNKRVVVLNPDFKLVKIIKEFNNHGHKDTFNGLSGVAIGNDGKIHIADTANHRIVSLNPDGTLEKTFGAGKSSLFGSNFVFLPAKVGVDSANRYYVIANNVTDGIMGFDANGKFYGYYGALKVQLSPADRFWRTVSTKAQRSQMQLFIPTEFTSLAIDSDNFVYATFTDSTSTQTIRKINPSGSDVLVNYNATKPICGDLEYRTRGQNSGPSKFVDITVHEKGIYSALDRTRGHVFTYDSEGNLLYIFGAIGDQLGSFKNPVAIANWNNRIYVLDQARNQIVVFEPTRYGQLINKAVDFRYDGKEKEAVQCWSDVLKLDSHYELAYVGIGKSLLSENRNKEAMQYLKEGMDQRDYSVAFRRYRTEWLSENGMWVTIVVCGIIAFFVARSFYRKAKNKRRG